MGIPYSRDSSDSSSHSYIDLVKEPQRISEIPELDGWPELAEFVTGINQPSGYFRTIGLEKSTYIESGRNVVNGYVGFGFRDLGNVQQKHYHYALFDNFNEFERLNPLPPDVYVTWDVLPTYYADAVLDGFSFDVWIRSVADSQDVARQKRVETLGILLEFLRIGEPKGDEPQ